MASNSTAEAGKSNVMPSPFMKVRGQGLEIQTCVYPIGRFQEPTANVSVKLTPLLRSQCNDTPGPGTLVKTELGLVSHACNSIYLGG